MKRLTVSVKNLVNIFMFILIYKYESYSEFSIYSFFCNKLQKRKKANVPCTHGVLLDPVLHVHPVSNKVPFSVSRQAIAVIYFLVEPKKLGTSSRKTNFAFK